MFAKPWEAKTTDEVVQAAVDASAQQPWEPPLPKRRYQSIDSTRVENIPVSPIQAQRYAKEYVFDFDTVAALFRARILDESHSKTFISKQATRFRRDPTVAEAIQGYMARLDSEKILTRERVLYGLLEEANYHGIGASASSRVAAWAKLAKLMGMELPAEDPNKIKEDQNKGGVLMIPFVQSIEEWEQSAVGQQAALKADVRT